jgi:hypothetical protein
MRNSCKSLVAKRKEKEILGVIGVDGRIILD